jgi:hypothetical protein
MPGPAWKKWQLNKGDAFCPSYWIVASKHVRHEQSFGASPALPALRAIAGIDARVSVIASVSSVLLMVSSDVDPNHRF